LPPKGSERAQVRKLQLLRKKRSEEKVKERLLAIREAAKSGKNLMSGIIDAVKAQATLGEISSVLREVYGTFNEKIVI
jgi:methylmalonyl-CoA mutase N-terminal domain/subunit